MGMKKRKPPFKRKKNSLPVVLVRWLDANTIDETYETDQTDHILAPTESVGFLIRTDRHGVTLATDLQLPDPNGTDKETYYRGKHHIPRGMIVDETVIKT